VRGGKRYEMRNNYFDGQTDDIGMNLVIDLPGWLEKAVEQKNPRVTLALAYSLLLEYDDLDKKLLSVATLN
jgi:hypothetical protein